MWVTFELIWMNFSAKNCNFMFFGIFPIINPIVNGNGWRYPKWRAINYFFVEIVSLHIDTAEKYWEKSQIGLCVFLGHPSPRPAFTSTLSILSPSSSWNQSLPDSSATPVPGRKSPMNCTASWPARRLLGAAVRRWRTPAKEVHHPTLTIWNDKQD